MGIIAENQHRECMYCEKTIEVPESMNFSEGKAFNESLCPQCYRKIAVSFD